MTCARSNYLPSRWISERAQLAAIRPEVAQNICSNTHRRHHSDGLGLGQMQLDNRTVRGRRRRVSAHCTVPHLRLTAALRARHALAAPLCSSFSPAHRPVLLVRPYMRCKIRFGSKITTRGPPVHSILMRDTGPRERVCVERTMRELLHPALCELVGGERHVGPIELLSSKLI